MTTNNQATIHKLAATNPGAMEFDAAVDAIRYLQLSPDLPPPTIQTADFGDLLGIALQWTDAKRSMWCRAAFSGEGNFNWMVCGPPLDNEVTDEDEIPIDRGAPWPMVDYVNRHLKSGQHPSSS